MIKDSLILRMALLKFLLRDRFGSEAKPYIDWHFAMVAVLAMVDICWRRFWFCRMILFFVLRCVLWMILLDFWEIGGLRSGIGLISSGSAQGGVCTGANDSSLWVGVVVVFS